MSGPNDNIRIVIPLTIRQRNGRPKILPPDDVLGQQSRVQDTHILKALGRAWAWRRKLESGEFATVGDIAKTENVTDRFVSRTMRLAYLSPAVLERLVLRREPLATSLVELIDTTYLPWAKQADRVSPLASLLSPKERSRSQAGDPSHQAQRHEAEAQRRFVTVSKEARLNNGLPHLPQTKTL